MWNGLLKLDLCDICLHCHIHVCYSPGLGSDGAVDKLVEKTCEDADVFVYICDGTRTLEEMVKKQF